MCGLVAAVFNKASENDAFLIRDLMVAASVRGLHATGVSFVSSEKIHTTIQPVPFEDFNFHVTSMIDNERIAMIGHCRYSTSDLEWNQPIADEQVAIAHNGVITQEDYIKWHQLYGIDTQGNKNDSALVWNLEKASTNGAKKHPLEHFPTASMAVVKLTASGGLLFYRNGKRPLHYYHNNNMLLVASTKDIIKRATGYEATECDAGVVYRARVDHYGDHVQLSCRQVVQGIEDLQDVVNRQQA